MLARALKSDLYNGHEAMREDIIAKRLPYSHFLDESTIKTKDGKLIQIIKLEGMPAASQEEEALDHAKDLRAQLLKGIADERITIHQHLIREKSYAGFKAGHFENDFARKLDKAYQRSLQSKGLYQNSLYISLVIRPDRQAISRYRSIFGKQNLQTINEHQSRLLKTLNEATHNLLSSLEPYGPKLLSLIETKNGLLSPACSFLSKLINFEDTQFFMPEGSLDSRLPTRRASFGRQYFELHGRAHSETKLGAVLSIKDYPGSTHAGQLDTILSLPCEFILSQSFSFAERSEALARINEFSRKLISAEEGAESLLLSLEEARDELASNISLFGYHSATLKLFAKDKLELEDALSKASSAFLSAGLIGVREDINLEAAYWGSLPGNEAYIARKSLISSKNFACFASLHQESEGQKSNNHWGEAISVLETKDQSPYYFNFHERDIGNFTLIGPTGGGKTVLLSFLMAQSLRHGATCIYFDKDRGADIFIRACEGIYSIIEPGKPSGLNPLQCENTPQNKEFLLSWLKLLIEADKNPISLEEHALLHDAVHANFEMPKNKRRLSNLASLLEGYASGASLKERLAPWIEDGNRAWLFDNETDFLHLNNPVLGFDMTHILDEPDLRTPWLYYIFHRISALLDGRKTVLMLDEGWKLLDDPFFSAQMKDWLKTIRKQNALLGLATQSASDAANSSISDTLIEQTACQIFLPNPKAREEDYCGKFRISSKELQIIRNLDPKSHQFLLRYGSSSNILRLDLTRLKEFLPILSSRSETVRIADKMRAELGNNPIYWLEKFIHGKH
tara:strand:+ start:2067 stop:4451 length:2385 start_codon:yes stop_codon:yes gene_type:complete